MPLRYKISLLAISTVLVVLIPLSLIYIRALAHAEEEEIQGRLRSIGKLMATELFTTELGSESKARQFIFLQAAQSIDPAILFTAVYLDNRQVDLAVCNRERLPKQIQGSDEEVVRQCIERNIDPSVRYVSVDLPQSRNLLLGYSTADIEQQRQKRQIQVVGWGLVLMVLAAAGSMFFAYRLTQPIRELVSAMSKVAQGNLKVRLKRRSMDEIGVLTQNFNQMVSDLRESVIERQRMSSELEIARQIQQRLLPQSEPEVLGLDVAGICVTYSEVGGDYYDYLQLSDGRLAIAMGDVAGHGISSGLLAAAVQGCLQNQVSVDPEPSRILAAVDRVVHLAGNQMMTLCYAVFDPKNGQTTIASAGHWSPCHYAARSGEVKEIYPSTAIAPALGTFPTDSYPNYRVSLKPGDLLVFYSDGILEAPNSALEMFGEARFHEVLKRYAKEPAKKIRDAILNEVDQFRGDAPQDDDIALVIVKRVADNGFR